MDTSNTTRRVCFFCRPESALSLGKGRTHGDDIFFGYGIPVCFSCGGLGITVDDEDFRTRAKEIHTLRNAYCPCNSIPQPEFPSPQTLEELVRKVTELHEKFHGDVDSFAAQIQSGCLADTIARHRLAREQEIARLYQQPLTDDPCAKMLLRANVAMLQEEPWAETLLQDTVMKYPEYSDAWLACGDYHFREKRNRDTALVYFYKAIEVDPDHALCYVMTADALVGAHKINEWRRLMARATTCDDFDTLNEETRAAALRAKEEYAFLNPSIEA